MREPVPENGMGFLFWTKEKGWESRGDSLNPLWPPEARVPRMGLVFFFWFAGAPSGAERASVSEGSAWPSTVF